MKYNAESFNGGMTLKDVREKTGMDRETFSSRLGISKRSLESFEDKNKKDNGEPRRIYIDSYLKMCDHYDCDIDFLLGVQDMPHKEDTDIHAVTGLSQNTINCLKEDQNADGSKDYIVSDVTNAKMVNSLFDTYEGKSLMVSIRMYILSRNILKLHYQSVDDMVRKVNDKYGQQYPTDYVLNITARRILIDAKQTTAISGLNLFGRNQNKIESVKEAFISKFKSEHFNRKCAIAVYNYLEVEDRLKVLQHDCYENLVQLLDSFQSNPNKMQYNGSMKGMAEFFGFTDMKLKPASIDIEGE